MKTQEIIEIARRLHSRNLLASADGNISYRISDREILMTPTGKNKNYVTPGEIATLDIQGNILSGAPSGERLMHLSIYKMAPVAKAVVHAHPPTAIALSLAYPKWHRLPSEYLSELILAAGEVPIVPYARPGTQAMGEVLEAYLPQHRLMILSRHGALCWGEDLEEAYNGMERLEHICQILHAALSLGMPIALPEEEILYLKQTRKTLGDKIL